MSLNCVVCFVCNEPSLIYEQNEKSQIQQTKLHKHSTAVIFITPEQRRPITTAKTSPVRNYLDLLKIYNNKLGCDGLRWFGFCAQSRAIIILLNSVTRYTITR